MTAPLMPEVHGVLDRALSATGEIVAGELDGPDSAAIIERLHDQALMPIDAVEEQARKRRAFELRLFRRRTVRPGDLALLTQQLSRLLKANLPLDRALEILASLAADKRSGAAVRGILERVRDGAGLAEALAAQPDAFPQAYVSMVRAGEEGGALPPVLSRLADFLARSEANRQKITSALIYPAILVIVAALSVALVLTVVLPQFGPLFEQAGARLPTSTRLVMALGDGLREAWWMVLLTIAISGGPFIGLLGTVVGVMITFAAIAASGDVNVNSIAPGIAAALLATVAGLAVAIPSLFGYNYFQTRIKDTMAEMAVFVDEIVTRIAEGNLGNEPAIGE